MGYFKRRYNYKKRYNRKLSTRNIFSKTRAKQQATQIHALNKRISSLYRKTKPETKVLIGNTSSYTFSSGALSDVWEAYTMPLPTVIGPADNQRIGDKIKPLNYQVRSVFEYYNNSQTGYHDSESSGCQVRIIAVQRKSDENWTTNYDLSEFIPNANYTGAEYSTLSVKPLRNGITEQWKVLKDFSFNLTSDRNQRIIKVNLRPRVIRFGSDTSANYVKFIIVVSGLHYDNDFKEYVQGNIMAKLSYTDC